MKVPPKFQHFAQSARHWLDTLHADANDQNAPDALIADYYRVMKWLGIKKFSEIRSDHYDRWAAGFVCYLAEGKAPSTRLATQFTMFSKWAEEEPPTLVELSDEIRGVFSRLIATDEEIEASKTPPTAHQTFLHRLRKIDISKEFKRGALQIFAGLVVAVVRHSLESKRFLFESAYKFFVSWFVHTIAVMFITVISAIFIVQFRDVFVADKRDDFEALPYYVVMTICVVSLVILIITNYTPGDEFLDSDIGPR